jgi:fructoselysine 6-kinase
VSIRSHSFILCVNLIHNDTIFHRDTLKFASVGDNCVDNYVELGRRFPGGNALNVAVYASRMPKIEVEYYGAVGIDEEGDFILSQMRKEGLVVKGVTRFQGRTAETKILIRNGDRVFAEYREGVQKEAKLPLEHLPRINSADLVHFTVWGWGREYIPSLTGKRSCDFSNQFNHPALEVMPYLDYSFFSGRELQSTGLDPEDRLRDLGKKTPGIVVMTLGEHGSLVYDGSRIFRGESLQVDVIDTLGAGDSYIAAFLCTHASGESIPDSIKRGHLAAAATCKRLGGWGG